MISKEEFIKWAKDDDGVNCAELSMEKHDYEIVYVLCDGYYSRGRIEPVKKEILKGREVIHTCQINWCTGGKEGGSCWDTEASVYYPLAADVEPEFIALDECLTKLCPNLSFLQYKKISRDIVRLGEYTNNDYYGNYSNYAVKYFVLEDLYDIVESMMEGN